MYVCMYVCNVCMDGWMYVCMYVCEHILTFMPTQNDVDLYSNTFLI